MGIIKNPEQPSSGILTTSQFSSLSSIKLNSAITLSGGTTFDQLVGLGITQKSSSSDLVASGTIASYDQDTFVLKYIQDRSLNLNQSTNDTTDHHHCLCNGFR